MGSAKSGGASRYLVDRQIVVHARRETVFRFFSDPARFATWWGEGSSIAAQPGGRVEVRYPGGSRAEGEVLEVSPPSRIVFTFGYPRENTPLPAGASRVEVTLTEIAEGTLVRLVHALPTQELRDQHEGGWRYYLALLANAAPKEQHGGSLAARIDAWCAAWNETDVAKRDEQLRSCAAAGVRFRDAHSALQGRDELSAGIAAVQTHMPGMALRRRGEPNLCGNLVACAYEVVAGGGPVVATGINVYELDKDGAFQSVTGFGALSGA